MNKLFEQEETIYTTGNLLDYEYFSKHYKLIALSKQTEIDLSKQTELENPDLKQQINFIERLMRNEGATMFFIIFQSLKKQLLNFHKMLQQLFDFDYV